MVVHRGENCYPIMYKMKSKLRAINKGKLTRLRNTEQYSHPEVITLTVQFGVYRPTVNYS